MLAAFMRDIEDRAARAAVQCLRILLYRRRGQPAPGGIDDLHLADGLNAYLGRTFLLAAGTLLVLRFAVRKPL